MFVLVICVLIALGCIGFWSNDLFSGQSDRKPILASIMLMVGLFLLCLVMFIPFAMGGNRDHESLVIKLLCLPGLFVIPALAATFSDAKKMRKKLIRLAIAIPLGSVPFLFWREIF